MPTKKKTSPETEPVVKAAPTTVEKKKTTKAKSPAATHKSPARKAAPRKSEVRAAAVDEMQVEKAAAAADTAFDAGAHHDEIAREAYYLFLNRGAHHGHEHEDWLRAIEIVKRRYQA